MRIVVGGQMDKNIIADFIQNYNSDIVVTIKSDIEAAMDVSTGVADYYVGSCATGAGAAIAMAMGIVGADKCVSISTPGKVMSEAEITKEVEAGKKAFGFVNTDMERVLPALLVALSQK